MQDDLVSKKLVYFLIFFNSCNMTDLFKAFLLSLAAWKFYIDGDGEK